MLSMFDKLWHPELTEAEALDMMLKGIEEVKMRLVRGSAREVAGEKGGGWLRDPPKDMLSSSAVSRSLLFPSPCS